MKNSLETKLGVFVVLAAFAAWAIMETLGGMEMLHGGYRVKAQFDTVQDLNVGSAVKMGGVEIGKVEQIALDDANNKVTVIMKMHPDAIVKTDSKASVRFTGLMGQNYVSITFGTPGGAKVLDGTTLATEEQPDINAVMTKLDQAASGIADLGKSFSGDKIDNLLGPLTDFMKQNSGHLGQSISNIDNITGQIASGEGTIGRLIYRQELYNSALDTVTNLQDAVADMRSTLSGARSIITGITNGQGTIGKLVTDDTLYTATTASMTNLNQILQKINQGQGTVGKLVNDQDVYKNAKLTLQKLDKAADGLEDTGPLSVIGTTLNALGL